MKLSDLKVMVDKDGRVQRRRDRVRIVSNVIAAVIVAASLIAIAAEWRACDGTVVRTVFWFECIE